MQITPNEIDTVEDAGVLDGAPVKLLRTRGGFWMAIGKQKGKPREEALAAGSHPAIVRYNLEKQYPGFQPAMQKSELASANAKVEKHSHFLSDTLRKSGHDIYSVESGISIDFYVTKQNNEIGIVNGVIENDTLVIKGADGVGPEFGRAMAGASSEKSLSRGLKKLRFE